GVLRLGLPKAGYNVCMEPTHVAGLRIEAAALALPVVFSRRRNAVAVVTAPDHVSALQGCQGLAHFRKTRVCGDSGMQACRDVLSGPVNAAHVLEQANGLGYRLSQRMVDLLLNVVDLAANFAGDVAGDQIVDLVHPRERAESLGRQIHVRVDEQLLSELDDGAVGATDVLAGATLRAQTRNDLNDEVDLVG